MSRKHILGLLGVVILFSVLTMVLLMHRSQNHQDHNTRVKTSKRKQGAVSTEWMARAPGLDVHSWMDDLEKTSEQTAEMSDVLLPETSSGSKNGGGYSSMTKATTARRTDEFVPFEYDSRLDLYPWHHVHFGRWRRRVVEPGHVLADRSIQPGPEMWELSAVMAQAVQELQQRTGDRRYREQLCLGGRYRHVPGVGVQYELYFHLADARPEPDLGHDPGMPDWLTHQQHVGDLDVEPSRAVTSMGMSSHQVQTYFHTVRLQRSVAELTVQYAGLSGEKRRSTRLVKIILPYYSRIEALQEVIARFKRLVTQHMDNIELKIVHFSSGAPASQQNKILQEKSTIQTIISSVNIELGGNGRRITLLEANGTFSVASGWLHGISSMQPNDNSIVLLSHVDLVFGQEFLQRCRANARPNESVYYPIVFSTYNPSIVYGVIKKQVIPVLDNYDKKKVVHQDLGYWLDRDYGVSCHYLSDLKRISAPLMSQASPSLSHRIYERYLKSWMDVVRMPDGDLVQVYQRVKCTHDSGRTEFNTCLKNKAMNEASKLEWGLWVYKNMGDTDEVNTFLDLVKNIRSA